METTSQNQTLKEPISLNEIVPAVRKLPSQDKLRLIRILAEELETAKEFISFEPINTYSLPTPHNSYGAAAILSAALAADNEESY